MEKISRTDDIYLGVFRVKVTRLSCYFSITDSILLALIWSHLPNFDRSIAKCTVDTRPTQFNDMIGLKGYEKVTNSLLCVFKLAVWLLGVFYSL